MSGELALSEPRLPPELEHMIFKITALAHAVGIPTLMLNAVVDDTALSGWLLGCTRATHLYAWFSCRPGRLSSISGFTNIRYLTVDVRALCGNTVPLPLNITLIPQLTHLSLNPRLASLLTHAALCANTHLQCIIILSSEAFLDDSPLIDNDRFVCIEVPYELDWLYGAVFAKDYWPVVDAFLAARWAGTIERSLYLISNGSDIEPVERLNL
ncbi:hypothetical protein C8R45DRAFT_1212073 [Mycena sanguinolenta]|nr:hypothetical protein C8R45DRAFT_1212073 [Mycena sanguinolenta]